MKKNSGMILPAAASLALMATPALAGETSAMNLPVGVSTAFSIVHPPAGVTEFYNSDLFHHSGKLNGDSGNPVPSSLHTDAFVEALHINHNWINSSNTVTLNSGFAINGVHQGANIGVANGKVDYGFADPDIISPILPRQRGSPVMKPTCCLFAGR